MLTLVRIVGIFSLRAERGSNVGSVDLVHCLLDNIAKFFIVLEIDGIIIVQEPI